MAVCTFYNLHVYWSIHSLINDIKLTECWLFHFRFHFSSSTFRRHYS